MKPPSPPDDDEDQSPPGPKPFVYVPRITDDQVRPKWRFLHIFGWIAGAAAVVALGFFVFKLVTMEKTKQAVVPTVQSLARVSPWTEDAGVSIDPAFSGDGKLVAYASDREGPGNLAIWLRPYPSGAPRRLTKEAFNATDPDFSPDNNEVVYHSEQDGGGIYIIPASGQGQPRLLVKGGMRPRFSPDGKWIAYYTISGEGEGGALSVKGRVYVIPSGGGAPRQILADFMDARYPVWQAGGELLLVEGTDSQRDSDWWVTPVGGGTPTRTDAFTWLKSVVNAHTAPERWDHDRILFAATSETNLHLWEIGIAPDSWKANDPPRPLTNGSAFEQSSAVGRDGRIVFARMQVSSDIWRLPIDGDSGTAKGELQPVTTNHLLNQAPTAGLSGAKVVYVSSRTGYRDVWVHDLKTQAESAATSFQPIAYRPVISADEKRIAYRTVVNENCAIVVQDLDGSNSRKISDGCYNLWDWSPDGSSLLIYSSADPIVSAQLLKTDSGRIQPLLQHQKFSVFDAGFSRDGHWIAFTAGVTVAEAQVFVAPFHGSTIKEMEWIPVSVGDGSLSAWSPDSGVLYFHSRRDGFHCIWAQKLNAAKHPAGDAFPVQHLHSVAFGMYMIKPNDFRMSVSKNQLLLNLVKETGNLWIAKR
jgi:Tol biopolymer transport system component